MLVAWLRYLEVFTSATHLSHGGSLAANAALTSALS
jgi:hypothetical protein